MSWLVHGIVLVFIICLSFFLYCNCSIIYYYYTSTWSLQ